MENLIVSVVTALITALLTSIFANRGIYLKAKAELQTEYQRKFNEKKWSIYVDFAELVGEIFETFHLKGNLDNLEEYSILEEKLLRLVSELLIIGSDKVIKEFRLWRTFTFVNGPIDNDSTQQLIKVVIEMRKDLGNIETDLDLDDILGSLVPNYQRVLP